MTRTNTPLLAFVEAVFIPLELRGRVAAGADNFRSAVGWLGSVLGRQPTLADFNRETMAAFVGRLSNVGLKELTTKGIRKCLWRVWRYAHQLGYAAEAPVAVRRPHVPKLCRHPNGYAYIRERGGHKKYL